jgi:hypothetical protein
MPIASFPKVISFFCVMKVTKNHMVGESLKTGPPVNAINNCPSSLNLTEASAADFA